MMQALRHIVHQGYVDHAAAYDAHMAKYDAGHVREGFFARLPLSKGMRLLEICCGTGLNLRHIPANIDYVGIDINPHMLSKAINKRTVSDLTHTSFLLADAGALPFEDGAFDAGIATFALTGTPNNVEAFHELERVVQGWIAILDFEKTAPSAGYGFVEHDSRSLYATAKRRVLRREDVGVYQWLKADFLDFTETASDS